MFHLQPPPPPNWKEGLIRLPPGALVKVANDVAICAETRATRPDALVYLRYVNDGMQVPGNSEAERVQRASAWFDAFIDGTFLTGSSYGIPHHQAVDVIGWWNEYYATGMPAAERVRFEMQERTAARIWMERRAADARLAHIRLAIAATAVGNEIPPATAETAAMYDAIVDYHPYTYWLMVDGQPVRAANDWVDLSGRWDRMWREWRAQGWTVDLIFGECGPFESAIDGWRSPNCLGGHLPYMLDAMAEWMEEVNATEAARRGHVLGTFAFFTSGRAGDRWKHFWFEQPEINALADRVRQVWATEPPPQPGLEHRLWQASVAEQISRGIPLNPNAALQAAILASGRTPVHREIGLEGYQIQAGEDVAGVKPRRVYVWQAGKPIWSFTDPN